MDYYSKYLKYKKKYLELKSQLGGRECNYCSVLGFSQHTGECWHDSFSMSILFSDNICNYIQDIFTADISIESYIRNIFATNQNTFLLPPNINSLIFTNEELLNNIIIYFTSLKDRFINKLRYEQELDENIVELRRQISYDVSIKCDRNVKLMIPHINKTNIYKIGHLVDESGGTSEDLLTMLQIINYICQNQENTFINHYYININDLDESISDTMMDNEKKRIRDMVLKSTSIQLMINKHSISLIQCNNIQYIYDDNGFNVNEIDDDENANKLTLLEYNWKDILLELIFRGSEDNNIFKIFTDFFDLIRDRVLSIVEEDDNYSDIQSFTIYFQDTYTNRDDYIIKTFGNNPYYLTEFYGENTLEYINNILSFDLLGIWKNISLEKWLIGFTMHSRLDDLKLILQYIHANIVNGTNVIDISNFLNIPNSYFTNPSDNVPYDMPDYENMTLIEIAEANGNIEIQSLLHEFLGFSTELLERISIQMTPQDNQEISDLAISLASDF